MESKKKVVVIINPIAGVRPKGEIPSLVNEILPDSDFDVQIVFTEYAGHASEIACRAVEDHIDYVVAIGGDGTINETARSLVGSDVAFGIVPMGSGNGLARHIQIPLEASRALSVIRDGHTELIDYGTVNGHIFFCTAGVGFDAQVSKAFSEMKQRGGLTYVRSVLNIFSSYKPSTYVIYTDDGRIKEKSFLIAIGNASQYGNNAYITPRASMQDGLMDVTLIKPFNILESAQIALQLFMRNIDSNPNILTFRSSNIRIVMPHPDVVHIDGEPIEMDSVLVVNTIPKGLKVLTPLAPQHNLLEPLQYAIEEIHYSIQNNLRDVVKKTVKKVTPKD